MSTHAFTAAERRQARALGSVLALVTAFFGVELAFAFVAKSDVLIADALHLGTDVLAIAVALTAMRIAIRRPTARFTYGLRRAEPVAAVLNATFVLGATAFVVTQGVHDLRTGGEPKADLMLFVSIAAFFVHAFAAALIHRALAASPAPGGDRVSPHDLTSLHAHAHGHEHGHGHGPEHGHVGAEHHDGHHHGHALNLRGAWLHLFGDALGSLAAVVAAIALKLGASAAVDPAASFVVAAILVVGALRLLREALLVLLEAAPARLPVGRVREAILGVPGVSTVHALHIWTLGAGHDAVTVHVGGKTADPDLGPRVARAVRERFHLEYATVQVEGTDGACDTSPESDTADP